MQVATIADDSDSFYVAPINKDRLAIIWIGEKFLG